MCRPDAHPSSPPPPCFRPPAPQAAGLKPYFSNGKNKVTLFAPSAAAWAYFYSECKNPKKGLVDLAFACNKEQLVSNKARLAAFIKYHVLASVVPAKYTPPPPGKALAQNWNKGPSFTKIDTIVGAGIFIRASGLPAACPLLSRPAPSPHPAHRLPTPSCPPRSAGTLRQPRRTRRTAPAATALF